MSARGNKDSKAVDPNQIRVENGKEEAAAPKPKRAPTREVPNELTHEEMNYILGEEA